MMRELPEWKKITPEHLQVAIEHIRTEFETNTHYGWAHATARLCRLVLHPDLASLQVPSENNATVQQCLGVLGRHVQNAFHSRMREGTPPSFFRAHFDLYYELIILA